MYHVLIVEDEAKIAAFMQKGLRSDVVPGVVFSNSNAALEAALSREFNLVLLNLWLPGMSGQQVLQELRSQHITCPVLVVTARLAHSLEVQAVRPLANGWLNKPFRMKDLLQHIEQLLHQPNSGLTNQPS
jgi:two-component system, OmpR family, copper resistance phosphate regulon response regulator CusR